MLFATGLDPERSTVFVQSHVTAHAEATWLLSAVVSYGQLGRMTQFKDKGEGRDFVSAGLFTYPILMAGDILLYQTDAVPIGDDQRQHLELARDVAERFNARFGQTFKVPEGVYPEIGARIMDLPAPTTPSSPACSPRAPRRPAPPRAPPWRRCTSAWVSSSAGRPAAVATARGRTVKRTLVATAIVAAASFAAVGARISPAATATCGLKSPIKHVIYL